MLRRRLRRRLSRGHRGGLGARDVTVGHNGLRDGLGSSDIIPRASALIDASAGCGGAVGDVAASTIAGPGRPQGLSPLARFITTI